MDKINESCAIQTLRQQCLALESKGYKTVFNTYKENDLTRATIVITNGFKAWKLSDPDLNVLISQLCKLHDTLIKKGNILKQFINLMLIK